MVRIVPSNQRKLRGCEGKNEKMFFTAFFCDRKQVKLVRIIWNDLEQYRMKWKKKNIFEHFLKKHKNNKQKYVMYTINYYKK